MTFEVSTPAEIFREAEKHNGRFLISRHSDDPKHEACKKLVQSGHARWISSASNYYPGIQLTGKPWHKLT